MDRKRPQQFKETITDALLLGFCLMVIACALMMITGCATTSVTTTQPGVAYKYDIKGTINGAPFDGVGVVPYSSAYDMKITSRVDVDLLTVTSCHRDFSVESAITLGWFQAKRGYDYKYNPAPGIEDVGSCLVRFGAYNESQGQNAWGVVDFETPDTTLPAENICNEQDMSTNGVSICQSRVGLIQRLKFSSPVKQAVKSLDPKCVFSAPSDGMTWEYMTPTGECVIAFGEVGPPYRIHRHTTVGYTDIQIRGQ